MKRALITGLSAIVLAFGSSPAFADGTAAQVVPGYLTMTPQPNCPLGPCFVGASPATPLPVTSSTSLAVFTPSASGARMTPLTVTTGDSSGALPAGATVVVSNSGANPMYCNVNGVTATVADQPIPASAWFAFTIPSGVTALHCIATGGSTTADGVGGAGLPAGAGGGGGGGPGGGSVTAAAGAYATGSIVDLGSYGSMTPYQGSGTPNVINLLGGIEADARGPLAAQAGAGVDIGGVDQIGAPWAFNLTQIGGTAVGVANPLPIEFGTGATLPAFASPPAVTVSGVATASGQTNGSQKTQIVDGSGNVVKTSVTGLVESSNFFYNVASSTLTRASNTTTYAANETVCLNTATTACAPITISIAGSNQGQGFITRLTLLKSGASTTGATFTLWLFSAAPGVTSPAQYDAILYTGPRAADMPNYIGNAQCSAAVATSDTAGEVWYECSLSNPNTAGALPFQALSGATTIDVLVSVTGAYTPASAETFIAYASGVY